MNIEVLNESPFVRDHQEGQREEMEKAAREVLELLDGTNFFMSKVILQRAEQLLDQACFLDMKNDVLQRKEPEPEPDPWKPVHVEPAPRKKSFTEKIVDAVKGN